MRMRMRERGREIETERGASRSATLVSRKNPVLRGRKGGRKGKGGCRTGFDH
jgi:hypothetical protein